MSDPISATLEHLAALRDRLNKTAQVKAAAAIPAELMPAAAPPQGAPTGDPAAQPGLLDPSAGGGGQPATPMPPEPPAQEPPITRAEIQDMLRQATQQQPGAPAAAPAAGGGKGGGAKQEQEKRLAQLEVAVSQLLKATGLGSPEQAIEEGLQEHASQAEVTLQQGQPQVAAPAAAPQAAPNAGPVGYGPGSGQASGLPAGGMKAASVSPTAALARRIRGR